MTGVREGRGSALLAYLRLVRLPNVFTSVADSAAGLVLVRGAAWEARELMTLMAISACIYGGGCVLNDLHDFALDSVERPSRPLPSGAVSKRQAFFLCVALFVGGAVAAASLGRQIFGMAVLLIGLVVFYDCAAKDIPVLGSLVMAACRGGNLLLGMLPGVPSGLFLLFPLISMGYVFGLTTLSKFETVPVASARPKIAATGWIGAAMAAVGWLIAAGGMKSYALIPLAGLLAMIGPPLFRWAREANPQHTGRAVKALVLALPLLDAVYVAGVGDWILAVPVAGCLVLAVTAAKWMHVS